jgi:hypothetical protein
MGSDSDFLVGRAEMRGKVTGQRYKKARTCLLGIIFLFGRHYTTRWCNVFIMQLSTERHVSTLQGHYQAKK